VSVREYTPSQRHLWQMTEGDDQRDFGYLGGEWDKHKHRKYCAILTRKQFDRFITDQCLIAEDVETMGSIGAPGFGFGWAPAISFNGESSEVLQNAYVTPVPQVECVNGFSDRDWDRIRHAVLSIYGY